MALDPVIEHLISTTIEGQFPAYYRDEGPVLVGFVRKYFEWMESQGQALYHARRIPEYKDIDTTVDDFIVHFKEKYLKNIQLETESNVRQLVKHSLDVYRARGSERAIDLLFRLVFGVGAKVYYPAEDMFQLSSGRWVRPIYLEVTYRDDLSDFVGQQVVGSKSGATGFVERYIRRKSPGKFVDVLYISAVRGNFQTGELINTDAGSRPLALCPRITGSLSSLRVTEGGNGFEVGDQVELHGDGYRGLARVTEVSDISGLVDFELETGGFGYSSNAQVLISEKVLTLTNVVANSAVGTRSFLAMFDQLVQPMAEVDYSSANGEFANGEAVFTYNAGVLDGRGSIIEVIPSSANAGILRVSVANGSFNRAQVFTTGNAVGANVDFYDDMTAVANVISETANTILSFVSKTGGFQVNEVVTSGTANGVVSLVDSTSITVTDRIGAFYPNTVVTGQTSGAKATITDVSVQVGVIDVGNSFFTNAVAHGSTSGATFKVTRISDGVGASTDISPVMVDTETVSIGSDMLSPYASQVLNANRALPKATANLTTVIDAGLSYDQWTIGSVQFIMNETGGSGYTARPLVRVYEPVISRFRRRGWTLELSGLTGAFLPGEIVTQAVTGARGRVRNGSIGSTLYLDPMSLFNEFIVAQPITGARTGTSATVTKVILGRGSNLETVDIDGNFAGLDAVITASTTTADGAVVSLDVTDSGFGYVDGERVSFIGTPETVPGTAVAGVERQGVGSGYYREKGGFLSDTKKLRDGWYYQEYSYEVQSSLALNRYRDMLREILHVAGTKAFGALYMQSTASAATNIKSFPISMVNVFGANSRAIAIASAPVTLRAPKRLSATGRALAVTRKDAAFKRGLKAIAAKTSFAEAGVDVSLVKTTVTQLNNYSMVASPRALALTGKNATLSNKRNLVLTAAKLSLAETGQAAALTKGADQYAANVIFLAGFEGTNGATAYTEKSSKAAVGTLTGATLTTSRSLFGTSSLNLDGVNDSAAFGGFTPAELMPTATSPWTIEFAVRFASLTAPTDNTDLIAQYDSSSSVAGNAGARRAWSFYWRATTGALAFRSSTDGVNAAGVTVIASAASTLDTTTFHRFALSFDGTNLRFYRNGNYITKTTLAGAFYNYAASPVPLTFGSEFKRNFFFGGNFDEVRITKGVARYTAETSPAYTLATSTFSSNG
jgi:hypothetical protein